MKICRFPLFACLAAAVAFGCEKDDAGAADAGPRPDMGRNPLLDLDTDGYPPSEGDCDDDDPAIHPDATEICGDGIDQDCSGADLDCDDADLDRDGVSVNQGDCDDADPARSPGRLETCGDGIDQDCSGADLDCDDVDQDGDGFSVHQGDCNDARVNIFPGAPESCGNGIDEDCDGADQDCLENDRDSDGVPDPNDVCPTDYDPQQGDLDLDGVGDVCDNCPFDANPDQADHDGNGRGDVCDPDDDGDGIPDEADACPRLHDGPLDTDGDGIGDACDNCAAVANADQADLDADDQGDACDCTIEVGRIEFEFNKADIKGDQSFAVLDRMADILKRYPEIRQIEVQGHTDTMGKADYNQSLSKARAGTVRDYLGGKVQTAKMLACGYGESQLAQWTPDETKNQANRRVQFVILDLDPA
ncbi:MAG: OmpA family protein, partial [Myxococcales bacterium]|nr:OmpA family protein [Myxococcales bacterium]